MATKKRKSKTRRAGRAGAETEGVGYNRKSGLLAPKEAAGVQSKLGDIIRSKVDKKARALPSDFGSQVRQFRDLGNYKTLYYNPDFPVLSFLYAIYAGGEHTLYCDFTEEYVARYLTGPNGKDAAAILGELENHRFEEPPPKPTTDQWTQILAILFKELTANPDMPEPFW